MSSGFTTASALYVLSQTASAAAAAAATATAAAPSMPPPAPRQRPLMFTGAASATAAASLMLDCDRVAKPGEWVACKDGPQRFTVAGDSATSFIGYYVREAHTLSGNGLTKDAMAMAHVRVLVLVRTPPSLSSSKSKAGEPFPSLSSSSLVYGLTDTYTVPVGHLYPLSNQPPKDTFWSYYQDEVHKTYMAQHPKLAAMFRDPSGYDWLRQDECVVPMGNDLKFVTFVSPRPGSWVEFDHYPSVASASGKSAPSGKLIGYFCSFYPLRTANTAAFNADAAMRVVVKVLKFGSAGGVGKPVVTVDTYSGRYDSLRMANFEYPLVEGETVVNGEIDPATGHARTQVCRNPAVAAMLLFGSSSSVPTSASIIA